METDLKASCNLRVVDGASSQVTLSAIKKSQEGNSLVVRLCEVYGGSCRAIVQVQRATAVWLSNSLERRLSHLAAGGQIELTFSPFELVTVLFELDD